MPMAPSETSVDDRLDGLDLGIGGRLVRPGRRAAQSILELGVFLEHLEARARMAYRRPEVDAGDAPAPPN